jgi:hypothetical protein
VEKMKMVGISELFEREHILGKDCWCKPSVTDYSKPQHGGSPMTLRECMEAEVSAKAAVLIAKGMDKLLDLAAVQLAKAETLLRAVDTGPDPAICWSIEPGKTWLESRHAWLDQMRSFRDTDD